MEKRFIKELSLRLGNISIRKPTFVSETPKEWEERPWWDVVVCHDRQNGEYNMSIASFKPDDHGDYELRYIGRRPVELAQHDLEDFLTVVRVAYDILNYDGYRS